MVSRHTASLKASTVCLLTPASQVSRVSDPASVGSWGTGSCGVPTKANRRIQREGGGKDEFEPIRASRRILRCPQRGQPPARRDVRCHRPSTGEQGGADYGGVGPLSGRASKGRRPCR